MSRHFGPIRQLGYVVRDIEAAMRCWTAEHGVGPFYLFERAPVHDLRYRGKPARAQIAFALAQSGPVQVELIQPLDAHPSLYREFLSGPGDGLQHVAYWTEAFEQLAGTARRLGMQEVWTGYTGDPEGRFAYFEGSGPAGTCIEISALSERKRALFAEVARAAEGWDGEHAVRSYAG